MSTRCSKSLSSTFIYTLHTACLIFIHSRNYLKLFVIQKNVSRRICSVSGETSYDKDKCRWRCFRNLWVTSVFSNGTICFHLTNYIAHSETNSLIYNRLVFVSHARPFIAIQNIFKIVLQHSKGQSWALTRWFILSLNDILSKVAHLKNDVCDHSYCRE